MKTLKYTIIKSEKQYFEYCDILEALLILDKETLEEEIELLTFLIEKWDDDHYPIPDLDPIELLKSLMKDHQLKAKDLVGILGVSKSTVSKMLNYQKGLSKNSIRILAEHFKMSQEAFNRDYNDKMKLVKVKSQLEELASN